MLCDDMIPRSMYIHGFSVWMKFFLRHPKVSVMMYRCMNINIKFVPCMLGHLQIELQLGPSLKKPPRTEPKARIE